MGCWCIIWVRLKYTKGWNLSTRNNAYKLRNCAVQYFQGFFFLWTLDFLNKIFLIGTTLFFNSPLKYHTEYLFSLFSCIWLTFREPQIPYVFSELINFRLICACLSHLYSEVFQNPLVAGAAKTQNCVSDILFQL